MKKILAFLLIFCSVYRIAEAESELWFSISQLRNSIQKRWTETYDTEYRQVEIDAPIIVPQANTMPVLQVVADWWDVSLINSTYKIHNSPLIQGYPTNSLLLSKGEALQLGQPLGEKKHIYLYPPFLANSELIPGFVSVEEALHLVEELKMSFNKSSYFDFASPLQLHGQYSMDAQGVLDPSSSWIYVNVSFMLREIPMIAHAGIGVAREDEELYVSCGGTCAFQPSSGYISFMANMYSEKKELAQDIPLCSFNTIQSQILKEIYAGHVRKIFRIQLGYALFNEPGSRRQVSGAAFLQDTVFYAVPTWFVECLFEGNSQKDLKEDTSSVESMGGRNNGAYTWLLLNAQTGEILDKVLKRGESRPADFAGFISWEEVHVLR